LIARAQAEVQRLPLHAPIVRIGDSSFTGDPIEANGLSRHTHLLSHLIVATELALLERCPQGLD
jgi:hypothetical protein